MIASKMKFIVENSMKTGNAARLGQLEVPHPVSGEKVTYPTPMYFVHTLAGSVPHLTSDIFHLLYQEIDDSGPIPPIQLSIDATYAFHKAVGLSGMPCSKFVGLPNCPTLLTLMNPLTSFPSGYNDKLGISIWPRFGRQKVTVKSVNQIITDYKPTLAQCLSDYDISLDTMEKRLKKGTQRSIDFLNDTVTHFKLNKATIDPNLGLLATIEPLLFKLNEAEGNKTLALILEQQNHISGFITRKNGPQTVNNDNKKDNSENINDENKDDNSDTEESFLNLTKPLVSKLPENKIRIVSGLCSLHEIFSLVQQGFDVFDSSVITKLTDEGNALVLPSIFFEDSNLRAKNPTSVSPVVNEELPIHQNVNSNSNGDEKCKIEDQDHSHLQLLNVNDKRFFEDFQPLSSDCSCYTCRKYTRSYIHHLHCTSELLGQVLLMKHNLTAFDRFFRVLRSYLVTGDVEKLEKLKDSLLPAIPQVEPAGESKAEEVRL